MSYLKRYVQSHPDNRMAWYLLGKQYVLEDKEGKANYCFLQAGSIYEAYERKKHPLASEPQQIIKLWNRKRKYKVLAARAAGTAVLLWIALLANPFAGLNENKDDSEDAQPVAVYDVQQQQRLRVVFTKAQSQQPVGQSLGVLLEGRSLAAAGTGLAVILEQQGTWRKWTGGTRILLSTKKQGSGEAYEIQMLDANTCNCQPDDATEAFATYKAWSKVQEERWTLTSAISHYEELFHKWPQNLEDMVRPYPNNVLSGETDNMRAMFSEVLKRLKTQAALAAGGSDRENDSSQQGISQSDIAPSAAAGQAGQGQALSLPESPLSIIVDKDTHRLAVISGDVIVRSYPVGLGGERTPSRSFYISEKVKNPNGRDDGEYGSRGMTLSGTRYAIHGTDEPSSIGKDESLGCVRMNKEDVEELFDLVPIGTKVEIKNGVIPAALSPAEDKFHLKPIQDETNSAIVYRWLT